MGGGEGGKWRPLLSRAPWSGVPIPLVSANEELSGLPRPDRWLVGRTLLPGLSLLGQLGNPFPQTPSGEF